MHVYVPQKPQDALLTVPSKPCKNLNDAFGDLFPDDEASRGSEHQESVACNGSQCSKETFEQFGELKRNLIHVRVNSGVIVDPHKSSLSAVTEKLSRQMVRFQYRLWPRVLEHQNGGDHYKIQQTGSIYHNNTAS